MSDEVREKPDSSRRDFLKKSLATGAVVWSAPAVTSLPGARALAQPTGSPPPCACSSDAFGLSVSILGGAPLVFGVDGCLADTGVLGIPGTATVHATVACGTDVQDGTCTASATIATLDVLVGPVALPTLRVNATVLSSDASATCPACGTTGSSTIATGAVSGTAIGGVITIPVNATCNTDILGLGIVIINEQTCDGETLEVNALHINVPGILEVIAAHSEAGATGCPCPTCP